MKFLKEKLNLRLYQETILNNSLDKNTLIVLPTGLGKTFIAIGLAGILGKKGKVLMLAPTKPLVAQHLETFGEFFDGNLVMFSGSVPTTERKKLWKDADIVFSTPQTIRNDIIAGRIKLEDVSLLVVDEAHRSVGDYAYVFIADAFAKKNKDGRIVGMTASPGSESAKIDEVLENLFTEKIEARDREHAEVKPYVKEIIVDYKFVNLPEEYLTIKKYIETAICDRLILLKRAEVVFSSDIKKITKKYLLSLQKSLGARARRKDFTIFKSISLVASLLKIYHALGLLESESLEAVNKYFEDVWKQSKVSKVRAVKDIVNDSNIKAAYTLVKENIENGIKHPKLEVLKDVVDKEIKNNKKAKILVFTEFRNNIEPITNELKQYAVERFVGQGSITDKGMSQKQQLETIEAFRKGDINVLVCTSVGEEGLDIPAVDLVVFYAPIPSAVRSIQRRGRTGRHKLGKLCMLITKNSKDEASYWASKRKESRMDRLIQSANKIKKVSLDDFSRPKEDKKVEIFLDAREQGKFSEELYNKNLKINLKNLEVGDIILSNDVVVERKTVEDFVNSLLDGRLFSQAKELKRNFSKPLILVEGEIDDVYKVRNVNSDALRSAIVSLYLDFQIPIFFCKDYKESVEFAYTIAKREQLGNKKAVSLRGAKKLLDVKEMQQYFVEGLPTIGPNAAKLLLEKFGCPKNIANASIDELKEVEQIGSKKAEEIRKLFDVIED
jgi:Fanconi anemia group M protein